MLLLLLLLGAALSHTEGASSTVSTVACPVKVYGTTYTNIYMNYYGNSVYFCFNQYKDATPNLCIRTQNQNFARFQTTVANSSVNPSHPSYPMGTIGNNKTSDCQITVDLIDTNATPLATITLRLFNNDYQVLSVTNKLLNNAMNVELVGPDDNVIDSVTVLSQNKQYNMALFGCRQRDVFIKAESRKCLPDGSAGVCTGPDSLATEPCSLCDSGSCLFGHWCSVTGSSIIDFSGARTSVGDRCAYNLLSQGDMKLGAVFRDRRRVDASLLDHLVLNTGNTVVHIERGAVKLNGTSVDFSTTQMPQGMNISKTLKEVTLLFENKFSLSFDGNSALIELKGPQMSPLKGLCANVSTSMNLAKSAKLSKAGCDRVHPDDPDLTINCQTATEHCKLLNGSLFASCHDSVDPEPHVAACKEKLCKYPSVDGFQCSFHEAYAKLCSKMNVTLPNWRTQAQCKAKQGFCQDTFCSEHEFCGEDMNGEACLCRAMFASKYKTNNTLGESTVCGENSGTLSMYACLLTDKGIKFSDLHLNNQSCRGRLDPETHVLDFGFDSTNPCGALVTSENRQIVFKNTVQIKNQTGMITRSDQFQVDFSCFYSQPEIKTMALRIRDSSVVQKIVSGAWEYNLTMKAYLDGMRTMPIAPNTELQLDQTVWVQLSAEGLDTSLVSVVTDSCWATSQPSSNSTPKYDLIKNGCANPVDKSVKVPNNGRGTSNYFAFNMFQFSGKKSDVYLHCKVSLCIKKNNVCAPVCHGNGRRRRRALMSIYDDPAPGLISMAWTY